MPSYTIYGETTDARIRSASTVYATARAGAGLTVTDVGAAAAYVDNSLIASDYTIGEVMIAFDTAVIPDGEVITAVELRTYTNDMNGALANIEARLHDWGATVDTADYVAGASLSTKTLLATVAASGLVNATTSVWTSTSAFGGNINKVGVTRMVLCASRVTDGTAPTGTEFVGLGTGEATPQTTQAPRLVVTTISATGIIVGL